MKILLANDDGYLAPGIRTLFEALRAADFIERVVMIAPESNRSAASHALTLRHPLRMTEVSPDIWCVDGTPSDCVHLGINGALADFRPDMVVSGINDWANLGDDVLYSGTVAAAVEGRFLGKPAIAVSLDQGRHFETAAAWTVRLLRHVDALPMMDSTILNVNIPDRPLEAVAGVKITRLGRRHQSEPVVCDRDPRGLPIYWIGPVGGVADEGPGTDFHAVAQGFVSITPLTIDMTHYAMQETLEAWTRRWLT